VQHRVEVMVIVLIGLSMSQRPQAEEILPAPELLEYLGTLVEDDGDYVDPLDMEDFQSLSQEESVSWPEDKRGSMGRQAGSAKPSAPMPSGDRP